MTATFVACQTQTVSFTTSPPNPANPGGTYTPAATATSGSSVTFSIDPSSTAGSCTISAGVDTFNAVGACVINATAAASGVYAAATTSQTVTITAARPSAPPGPGTPSLPNTGKGGSSGG